MTTARPAANLAHTGYTTEFEGRFDLDRPLTTEHNNYLLAFSQTRRMRRNAKITVKRDDRLRVAACLPVGVEGGYFVGETGWAGQDKGIDVLDYNAPPAGQPGLWCQWVPTRYLDGIEWDGAEKFSDYVEWLRYLIEHFLAPWGYTLNGTVTWQGEEIGDVGRIVCADNVVTTQEPSWT